jgi:hypothetical protein
MDFDEVIKQMQQDELEDGLELSKLMTVGDYARARGVRPQLIHSYIKRGKLERLRCNCNRLVIDVEAANELFDSDKKKNTLGIELDLPEEEDE